MNFELPRSQFYSKRRQTNAGFTLLEVLVSLVLFAVLSSLLIQTFGQQMQYHGLLNKQQSRWAEVMRAWQLIERDVSQIAPRPARDAMGDPQAAILYSGNNELEFSSFSWFSRQFLESSAIVRIRYVFDPASQSLWRESWQYPDRVVGAQVQRLLVLDKVMGFKVRLLTHKQQWRSYWPLPDSEIQALPSAMQVTIISDVFGTIDRLFVMPHGSM